MKNLIKNPNRQNQIMLDKARVSGGTQTEYDRLGLDPIKRGDIPKAMRQPLPYSRKIMVEPAEDLAPINIQGQEDSYYNQVGMASGRREHTWLPEQNDNPDMEYEYDNVPSLREQPEQHQTSGIISDLSRINGGQFVLCQAGEIICISNSLEEMEQQIEELVFSQEYNVDLADLKVFKCLDLKAGVLIKG